MKLGTEPKKVGILAVLAVVGLYSFYANALSGPEVPVSARTAPPPPVTPSVAAPSGTAAPTRRRESTASSTQFRPSLRPRRPEDRIDPAKIDPTLRLDLLAKVQAIEPVGGGRNLFQFGPPPPPPEAKSKEPLIVPKTPAQIAQEIAARKAQEAAEPPKPPPPPINLRYYGFSTLREDGRKRAFFLDGEEILVATEGETLKRRYKVIRIGVNSVVMEDTESKNQQTLPLQEEAAG